MPRIRAESVAAHKEASRAANPDVAQNIFLANGYSELAIADRNCRRLRDRPHHHLRILQFQGSHLVRGH